MSTLTAHRFWRHCRIATFIVMILAEFSHANADSSKPVTIETIINTWKERESRAGSLDFVAEGTESRPERIFSVNVLEAMGRPSKKAITVPDTSFKVRLRLAIDGNGRFRLDYDGKALVPTENGYPDQRHIDIFYNGVRNTFFPVGAFGYPNAHIRKGNSPIAVGHPQALPIRIVYRPFDPEIGVFDASKLILTKNKGVVEDEPSLVLTHMDKTIWVDPARNFVPTRYYENKQGVTTRNIEIKYTADAQHGWVPISWNNVSSYKNGNTQDSVRAIVTKYRIGEPISNETFDLQYPPGTWVRDYIKGESYIIREEGNRRMVPKSEDGKDYDYLLHTNPPSEKRRSIWSYFILTLLLMIIIALCYRKLKRRRKANGVA